jgi:Pin2-interacting protein X1
MGLSGNTRKTKIPDDPRNTKWANDVSAPGFRLLSSMGWTPASPSLGLAASQDLITAGGSRAFSKKISVIPIAKDDNLGIGARRGAGSGGMRAMGVPMMLGGSAGMGFVTAAPVVRDDDGVVVPQIATATSGGGGEFGRLLERLNAANSARNSATPEVEEVVEEEAKEETKAERKARKLKKKELKRKRSADDEDSVAETIPEAVIEPVVVALDPNALSTMLLRNPRMA